MNSLSLYLYLADVLGSLDSICFAIAALGGVVLASFWATIGAFTAAATNSSDPDLADIKSNKEIFEFFKRRSPGLLKVVILAALLSFLLPSKTTMYMIAASQVGEQAINSPEGKKLQELLGQKIKQLTDEE